MFLVYFRDNDQNMITPQTPVNQSSLSQQTPDTNAVSPFGQDPPVAPHNGTTINVGPFPQTPEGWHQHGLVVTAWKTKWGETTLPAPDRLYHLSPGTVAVRSWECFCCGQHMNPPHSVAENSCSHTVINAVECSF